MWGRTGRLLFFVSLFPHGFCVSVYSGWAHLLSSSPLFRGKVAAGVPTPFFLECCDLAPAPCIPAVLTTAPPTSQQIGKPTSWQTPHLRPPRSPALIAACNECTMQSLQTAITTQPTHPAPVTFTVHHTPLCAHPLLPHPAALTFSYPGVNQKPTPHTHPAPPAAEPRHLQRRPPLHTPANSPTSQQVEKLVSRKVGKSKSWQVPRNTSSPRPSSPPALAHLYPAPPTLTPPLRW